MLRHEPDKGRVIPRGSTFMRAGNHTGQETMAADHGHGHGGAPGSGYMGLPNYRVLLPRLWVAIACTVPVLVLAMGPMVGLPVHRWLDARINGWLQFAFTTPVFWWSGWFFILRFARSWRGLDFNMFTLTVLGTGAAYVFSLATLLFPNLFPHTDDHAGGPALYFEAAAVITTIVLLGQVLEQRAQARTGEAVRALLDLTPPKATRLAGGREEEIPIEQVEVGDKLRVRPGERVPVDGIVTDGASAVDESMLTGEPVPVDKSKDDTVSAGTLNKSGSFVLQATKVGRDTVLARIVALVRDAQESEPPVQRLVDRISSVFLPVVIAIAVATFVLWMILGRSPALPMALSCAVAVLIIACPCALGLATPVSIVTGVGRGARAGVLVRHAAALEQLRRADTVLFDKTGTLTAGRPALVEFAPAEGLSETEFLALVASAETPSEHPLARAITQAARERGLALAEPQSFESTAGGGVRAMVDGKPVRIGKFEFVEQERLEIPDAIREKARSWQETGRTVVVASIDGRFGGILALEDPIKPDTADAVRELHRLGLRLLMVTGDNALTARHVASDLHLDEVHAAATPESKQALVRKLRDEGACVAFAGDGINDAPALASAHVGIAMGTGTDVAMESAGLILVKGDLGALVRAVHLSRAVLANIKQNLFFAFLYNGLGIPLAAGALFPLTGWLLNPMVAGVAMSLSSLSVVANALRLRHARL